MKLNLLAVCAIDEKPATVYCCVCEQYYCDYDSTVFHAANPDFVGHMRLRLRPAPVQCMISAWEKRGKREEGKWKRVGAKIE
jgi:hypothetical protein